MITQESQWQREDRINSKWTEQKVERLLSKKYQAKMLSQPAPRALACQLDKGWHTMHPVERRARCQEQSSLRNLERQQQEAFGFAFTGGGLSIPTAVIWWASSWAIATTYPAAVGGQALYNSYIQYQGTIYAIPGTTPSTPGTPPTGGVWVALTTTAPLWVGANPNPRQSVWANPTTLFPQPAPYTDVVDSYWQVGEVQNLAAIAANFYIPAPGRGVVQTAVAHGLLQFNIAGSWTTVWTNTATTFIWMEFDGLTARWLSDGTINAGLNFYRIRQSSQG